MALGIDGLWSGVVRYAHLFESSTFRQDFEAALSQIIRDSFRRVPVTEMLAIPLHRSFAWLSRQLCLLPAGIEVVLLQWLNGDLGGGYNYIL